MPSLIMDFFDVAIHAQSTESRQGAIWAFTDGWSRCVDLFSVDVSTKNANLNF
jgi:hypothetical protein